MRKWLFCMLSFMCISVYGQKGEITGGGFGHFLGGGSLGYFPGLTQYLQSSDRLGSAYTPMRAGYTLGGGGYGFIGRLMFGGTAAFHGNAVSATDSARVWHSLGSAFFNMGYVIIDRNRWFAFPYAGVGGSGYTLKLRNTAQQQNIAFDRLRPLTAGDSEEYIHGAIAWDAGISVKYFLITESEEGSHGGMLVGIDLGCSGAYMASSRWKDANGTRMSGPGNITGLTPYVRVTLGGGGLTRKKVQE